MARCSNQAQQALIYTRVPAHTAVAGTWERCYEAGSFLWFVDANHTATNLRTAIGNMMGYVEFTNSGGATLSRKHVGGAIDSLCIIPSRMGLVIISSVNTVVSGSMAVPSAYSGQIMTIMTRGNFAAVGSIRLGFSDCDNGIGLLGVNCFDISEGESLSSITLLGSNSCNPIVTLVSPDGNDWSVLKSHARSCDGDNPEAFGVIRHIE